MPSIPQIISAGATRTIDVMGFVMDWKVTAEQTGDAFSVVEAKGSAGAGPPLHYHESADEFFYVIDGIMTFKVGREIKKIGNSGVVWIPRNIVHSFLVNSSVCRFLFGYVPAGTERMFTEADSIAADRAIQSEVLPSLNREKYGTIIVGPPLCEWLQNNSQGTDAAGSLLGL
jgi:quercetin dioxygenase-like cupin family protein